VVVDSGSTDRTAEIASTHGVSFFERTFTNHADQKNYAASCARNDWIFLLDADEELSGELRKSLMEWKQREPESPVYEWRVSLGTSVRGSVTRDGIRIFSAGST